VSKAADKSKAADASSGVISPDAIANASSGANSSTALVDTLVNCSPSDAIAYTSFGVIPPDTIANASSFVILPDVIADVPTGVSSPDALINLPSDVIPPGGNPPVERSQCTIYQIVRESAEYCRQKGFDNNPVEILRFYQTQVIEGRILEVNDLTHDC